MCFFSSCNIYTSLLLRNTATERIIVGSGQRQVILSCKLQIIMESKRWQISSRVWGGSQASLWIFLMFDDVKSPSVPSPWNWFSQTLTDELPTTLNIGALGVKTHFTFILILVTQSAILSPFVQRRLSAAAVGAKTWKGEATGRNRYLHSVKNCLISVDKTRHGLRDIP